MDVRTDPAIPVCRTPRGRPLPDPTDPFRRLRPTEWPNAAAAMVRAALAVERLRTALDAADPLLGNLVRERLAYASAVRIGCPAGPVPHASVVARLYGARPAEGAGSERPDRASAICAAYETLAATPQTGEAVVPAPGGSSGSAIAEAVAAAFTAERDGNPMPSSAALPALARAGLLPAALPPVAWCSPDLEIGDGGWAPGALGSMADAFVRSGNIVRAAGRFLTRGDAAVRADGRRSSHGAFAVLRGAAGLPVLDARCGLDRLPVSRSAFHDGVRVLVSLGVVREVTGRGSARAWVASDPDLTPDYRTPSWAPAPPKADRLSDVEPLPLQGHDDVAARALRRLDRLLADGSE